ncbi:YcaO-like family protein [Cyanobium sp. Alchichica 3B3-8F6]|nr:YcaO-like family protein [Cyanobium sp. Alchichica 3B3-8F6]
MTTDSAYSNNWRKLHSSEALMLLLPRLKTYGITRVANITGLDFLSIPVYTAYRPRAFSLVVSCGKGITHADSAVSAIMESIETDVAENFPSELLLHAPYSTINKDLSLHLEYIPVLESSVFNVDTVFSWLPCRNMYTGKTKYVPAASVGLSHHLIRDPLNTFVWGSNGLASGFSQDEARLSALYELIERDAVISWQILIRRGMVKDACIDLNTISYSSTIGLVNAIHEAGLQLYLFDRASDLGLPVYRAAIYSPYDTTIRFAEGLGCHHSDEIAINRAITEAVQSRTVIIAGSRDDLTLEKFHSLSEMNINEQYLERLICENHSPLSNEFLKSFDAVDDILRRLRQKGFLDAFEFVFPHEVEEISVVRVIVPGLQSYSHRHSVPLNRSVQFTPRLSGLRSALHRLRTSL